MDPRDAHFPYEIYRADGSIDSAYPTVQWAKKTFAVLDAFWPGRFSLVDARTFRVLAGKAPATTEVEATTPEVVAEYDALIARVKAAA